MADPISAAVGIVGLAQTLGGILNKVKDKAVRDQLQDSIFQIREAALRLQEENAALREENRKLREAASERVNPADYELRQNAYWRKSDGAGPYCLKCFEGDHVARTLVPHGGTSDGGQCAQCGKAFYGMFVPPESRRPRTSHEEWWNPSGR